MRVAHPPKAIGAYQVHSNKGRLLATFEFTRERGSQTDAFKKALERQGRPGRGRYGRTLDRVSY